MRTLKIVLLTFSCTLLLGMAVGLAVIFTGAYDVAATREHLGVTRWALHELTERSVARRAVPVTGAAPTDSAALAHGFEHFDGMCVSCHGAPGVERGEIGQGMNPEPPDLAEEVEEWSDAELFWITKHGVRLAGMPAFGPTHSDEEIWALVGFMRRLPDMDGEAYQALVVARDSAGGETGHAHDGDAGDHTH